RARLRPWRRAMQQVECELQSDQPVLPLENRTVKPRIRTPTASRRVRHCSSVAQREDSGERSAPHETAARKLPRRSERARETRVLDEFPEVATPRGYSKGPPRLFEGML